MRKPYLKLAKNPKVKRCEDSDEMDEEGPNARQNANKRERSRNKDSDETDEERPNARPNLEIKIQMKRMKRGLMQGRMRINGKDLEINLQKLNRRVWTGNS